MKNKTRDHTYYNKHSVHWVTVILCVVIACLGSQGTAAADSASNTSHVLLSAEEATYIKRTDVRLVYDPAWPPYDFRDSMGRHAGIAADYLQLIVAKTGLRLEALHTDNWSETMDKVRSGDFDIISLLNNTPERRKLLAFTSPLFEEPLVIVGKYPLNAINLKEAEGPIAIVQGYMVAEAIQRDYPNLPIVTGLTTEDTLQMVNDGSAQATVITAIEARHLIRKHEWSSLKIVGGTSYTYELSIGVRKDERILLTILQKGVDSISQTENKKILTKWLADPEDAGKETFSHWRNIGIALMAFAIGLYIYRKVLTPKKGSC